MKSISELTERQIKILKTIIDDYIVNGKPIGSEFLEKKFKLGFSPATIRNEMVVLGKNGYIQKAHFSSGRIPTPKAFRLYINSLLPKKQLSTAEEAALKNEVWDYQNDMVRFLEESATSLAKKSNLLSLVLLDTGFRYYSGVGNLLAIKEFDDNLLTRDIFDYLEDFDYWLKLLNQLLQEDKESFQILIGEDYLHQPLFSLGGIFSHFKGKDYQGAIGVIGPCRLEYSNALPLVNYTASIIRQVIEKNRQ
jgi:heat-inducible transcriptional repressor